MVRPEEGGLNSTTARLRRDLSAIFRAAVGAAGAARLVDAALTHKDVCLFVAQPLHLLGVGKASAGMLAAVIARAPATIVDGLAIGAGSSTSLAPSVAWIEGSHPVPDARSVEAGRRALAYVRGVPRGHATLVLLSGGASALMALPRPGITLEDKQATTRRLLLAGADIHSLNAVRKHLSGIKGGQLAAGASGPVLALAISDVVGDDPSVIGSGPTVPDPTTFADALAVLERFGGMEAYPPAVVAVLGAGARGQVAETPKPGDVRLSRTATRVIGSRASAAAGAAATAESLGYRTIVLAGPVVGQAREAGPRFVADALREASGVQGAACVIGTGETTVRVVGRGRGGRNQELALSVAGVLATLGRPAALLSGGTDGIDGPTDAAGAVCDSTTLARSALAGLGSPDGYLADNDSHRFFGGLGDLVTTGPTGTNVGDVQILLLAPAS